MGADAAARAEPVVTDLRRSLRVWRGQEVGCDVHWRAGLVVLTLTIQEAETVAYYLRRAEGL